jgi:nonribosomal peptide synthetase DhbF
MANTRVYVLDDDLNETPIGVVGQLYIGGDGLARGYLGRPGLTASRFIANPYGEPGERMYRTGDRVKWRLDGELEFLGRSDDQVKIRGFRVEPGEIEAALLQHERIGQAVVVARSEEGDKRLVAYVVSDEEESTPPAAEELREHLRERLPEHMVPSAFVLLKELPLTANGKVDHRRLPAPDLSAQLLHRYVGPQTPTEQVLAQIWREALHLERVGINDNFFDVGGHSIALASILVPINRALGRELTLLDLFRYPSIAALARYLRDDGRATRPTEDIVSRAAMKKASLRTKKTRASPKY